MPTDPASAEALLDDAELAPDEVEWSRWPAAERPAQTALLLLIVAGAAVAAGAATGSVACGLLALTLLLATTVNHMLPTRYVMNGDGLCVRGLRRAREIKWSRIDTARVGREEAVLLYTTEHGAEELQFSVDLGPRPEAIATALRQRLLDAGVPLV